MSEPLGRLLGALQSAGLSLDSEGACDALWLALRIAERQPSSGASFGEVHGAAAGAVPPERDGGEGEPGAAADPLEELPQSSEEIGALAVPARRLRLVSPPSLPGSRTLGRAFQPLRREAASPIGLSVDLEETVRRAAEENLWVPVLRPIPERWLSLALVVERSLSMGVFQGAVRELRRALRWSGAFRDLRVWWLEAEGGEARVYARPRDAVQGAGARRLREVPGAGRRSLVLVLSDCISDGWYDGRILSALSAWSRSAPVALLQVLPERMWPRTALGEGVRVRLRASAEAQTNGHLRWIPELPDPWRPASGGFLLPAASLEAASLRPLARMIAGQATGWMRGFLFDLEEQALGPLPVAPPALGADECVLRFLALSSTQAVRLAALLAASPVLSLGVLRLLRRELVAEAGPVHEAEVLLGGILRVRGVEGAGPLDPEGVQIEFLEGVRPLLLNNAPAGDVLRVLEQAARLAESPGLEAPSFELLLANPEAAAGIVDPEAGPFARQAAEVLARLGGHYARIARSHPERGDLGKVPDRRETAPRATKAARPPRIWEPRIVYPLPRTALLIDRDRELKELYTWWEESASPSVLALIGPGGIGKTTLAAEFLRTIAGQSWEGGVFVWSFYVNPSIAHFLHEAWMYFTESQRSPLGDDWTDLVHALRGGSRHLLVLDGIEASLADDQPGSGPEALESLLHEASLGSSRLRALVTSRNGEVPVKWARLVLGGLAPAEGLKLLKAEGVSYTDEELRPLVTWSEGHPLSLSLIAGFLRTQDRNGLAALRNLTSSPPPRDPRTLREALDRATYTATQRDLQARLIRRAEALERHGDFERAEVAYREALTFSESLGDQQGSLSLLQTLGRVAESTRRLREAQSHYREAVQRAEMLGDLGSQLASLLGLARILRLLEDDKAVRGALDDAWAVASKLGDRAAIREIQREWDRLDAPGVFLSASYADRKWTSLLLKHLAPFQKSRTLQILYDQSILEGEPWRPTIFRFHERSRLAILLISPAYLSSSYILKEELPNLFRLEKEKRLRLLPVLVESCHWQLFPELSRFQIFPGRGRALAEETRSRATADLTQLAKLVEEMIQEPTEEDDSRRP